MQILTALGASGELLTLGKQYITVIALGTLLQVFGTGLVPFIRNYGGSFWAMVAMLCGFVTNIILDYAFVWAMGQGMCGAALATIIGQEAIAIYACISYIICIVYLVLQGVGDGSQPLMSQFYGAGEAKSLREIKTLAYEFALVLVMLGLMLVLPPLFGGQIMIWWSAVFAKIITAGIGIFSSIENHTCQNIILLISS